MADFRQVDDHEDGSRNGGARHGGLSSLPLAALVLSLACVLGSGTDRYLTAASYAFHMDAIAAWAAGQPFLAAFAYVALTIAAVAISLPGGVTLLAIAGGALFGMWMGTALYVAAAVTGSFILFLAARPALSRLNAQPAGRLAGRTAALFRGEAFWIVLAMRLAPPILPVITTLAAAALGAPARSFAAATALGTIPGTVILAYLGSKMASGAAPDASALWVWPNLLLLMTLAALALLPALLRGWWSRRADV